MRAKGSTYRRCGCRDEAGKLLTKCPLLSSEDHGTWYYRADVGRDDAGKRLQQRKGGFSTEAEADAALADALRTRHAFGNVRQLPSGRQQARWINNGKQFTAPQTFASAEDAREWLASNEERLRKGETADLETRVAELEEQVKLLMASLDWENEARRLQEWLNS